MNTASLQSLLNFLMIRHQSGSKNVLLFFLQVYFLQFIWNPLALHRNLTEQMRGMDK